MPHRTVVRPTIARKPSSRNSTKEGTMKPAKQAMGPTTRSPEEWAAERLRKQAERKEAEAQRVEARKQAREQINAARAQRAVKQTQKPYRFLAQENEIVRVEKVVSSWTNGLATFFSTILQLLRTIFSSLFYQPPF